VVPASRSEEGNSRGKQAENICNVRMCYGNRSLIAMRPPEMLTKYSRIICTKGNQSGALTSVFSLPLVELARGSLTALHLWARFVSGKPHKVSLQI
jgi:hypothetical protein